MINIGVQVNAATKRENQLVSVDSVRPFHLTANLLHSFIQSEWDEQGMQKCRGGQ